MRALCVLDGQRGQTWLAEMAMPQLEHSTTEDDMVMTLKKSVVKDEVCREEVYVGRDRTVFSFSCLVERFERPGLQIVRVIAVFIPRFLLRERA